MIINRNFSKFDEITDAVVYAKIIDDTQLEIKYYSGDEKTEVIETIDLITE